MTENHDVRSEADIAPADPGPNTVHWRQRMAHVTPVVYGAAAALTVVNTVLFNGIAERALGVLLSLACVVFCVLTIAHIITIMRASKVARGGSSCALCLSARPFAGGRWKFTLACVLSAATSMLLWGKDILGLPLPHVLHAPVEFAFYVSLGFLFHLELRFWANSKKRSDSERARL